jgi:hypothetical protein
MTTFVRIKLAFPNREACCNFGRFCTLSEVRFPREDCGDVPDNRNIFDIAAHLKWERLAQPLRAMRI